MRFDWRRKIVDFFRTPTVPLRIARQPRPRRFILEVETLEERVTPAIDMVTVAGDANVTGTLRYVIAHASTGDTIEFNTAAMGTNVIDLNQGTGTIVIASKNLTIGDSTAAGQNIIIDGTGNNGAHGMFELTGTSSVSFTNLTIQKGSLTAFNPEGGAIEANGTGTLTLQSDTFADNSVMSNEAGRAQGGAVYNANGSTVNVTNSLFVNNTANNSNVVGAGDQSLGGAIYNNGNLTVQESTLVNNTASNPGDGTLAEGGAIYNDSLGTTELIFCTVTANSATTTAGASTSGGGIFNNHNGASLSLTATILAGNTDTSGTHFNLNAAALFTSGGHNLLGSDIPASGTDRNSDTPGLAPLGYFGGPTQTLAMTTTSPAYQNGGSFNGTDQRGFSANVADADIGAFQSQAVPTGEASALIVNSTADFADSAAAIVGGTPTGTMGLRAAINLADVAGGVGTPNAAITFAASLAGQTITVGAANSPLTISNNSMTIENTNAGSVTVSGNNNSEVFDVAATTVSVTISSLLITDGSAGSGGGILNAGSLTLNNDTLFDNTATGSGGGAIFDTGTLNVTDTTFMDNQCTIGVGGAIFANSAQSATITNSTFAGNTAGQGGAIFCQGSGTVNVQNSTFTDNTSTEFGGAFFVQGFLFVNSSTITGNTADSGGGGISLMSGGLTLAKSIVSNNTQPTADLDLDASPGTTITDNGYNLLGTQVANDEGIDGTGDVFSNSPGVAALGYYGGPTQTMPVLAGSPALNAVAVSGTNITYTDQRGFTFMQTNGFIDIGAFQTKGIPFPTDIGAFPSGETSPFAVSTLVDSVAGALNGGTSLGSGASAFGDLSLREAIDLADLDLPNLPVAGETITFDPTLAGQTITLSTDIALPISASMLVTNTNAQTVTVSANAANPSQVVNVSGGTVTISGLTISDGVAAVGGGLANSGTLTLVNDTLANNTANGIPTGDGGGIFNNVTPEGGAIYNSGTLNVGDGTGAESVIVENNTASGTNGEGAGIYNVRTLTLMNHGTLTLHGNTATGTLSLGGGIYNAGTLTQISGSTLTVGTSGSNNGNAAHTGGGICNIGTLTLTNATIQNNTATTGGGVFTNLGVMTLTGSTVQGNNAEGGGGIIMNGGSLTVDSSTIGGASAAAANTAIEGGGIVVQAGALTIQNGTLLEGNTATFAGGGLYQTGGTVVFKNVNANAGGFFSSVPSAVVSGNDAAFGAGIEVDGGGFTMDAATVSGNTATSLGGGLHLTGGSIVLGDSTFTANSATTGGGLNVTGVARLFNDTISGNSGGSGVVVGGGGTLVFDNDTVAFNTGGGCKNSGGNVMASSTLFADNPTFGYSGTITSEGHNLFQDATVIGHMSSDKLGQTAAMVHLGSLAFNGGPTETNALLKGSSAIDAGANILVLATDQRGAPRKFNGVVDIGAFEYQPIAIVLTPPSLPVYTLNAFYTQTITASGGAGTVTLSYTLSGPLPHGLTISPPSPTTGAITISGTPTVVGSVKLTVTATDGEGDTTTIVYVLTGQSPQRRGL